MRVASARGANKPSKTVKTVKKRKAESIGDSSPLLLNKEAHFNPGSLVPTIPVVTP
jgi:hypothetical protein